MHPGERRDEFQGKIITQLIKTKLKAKTLSAVVDTDSKYSVGLTEIVLSEFKKKGGIVDNTFKVNGDQKEFSEIEYPGTKTHHRIVFPGGIG